MELKSSAFGNGEPIPRRHTCEGDDLSPPLTWTEVPEGTTSLALIVDDPSAPGGSFTHWLGWGLDPASGGLPEGQAATVEGRNDFGQTGYGGPCPPPGHGPHRYVFRLYAVAGEFELEPGATRTEVARALAGSSVASVELIGTYER